MIRPVGLGGGGAMFEPVVSPQDRFLRFVACDMTGLYRTADGGANWELIDGHQMLGNIAVAVVFDPPASEPSQPSQPNTLYAYYEHRGLRESGDRGTTWSPVQLGGGLTPGMVITALATGPGGRLFVGTGENGAYVRDGSQWIRCVDTAGAAIVGTVVRYVSTADPSAPMYLATVGPNQIYRANSMFSSWSLLGPPGVLTGPPIRNFAGGSAPGGPIILYVAMQSTGGTTISAGGLWCSTDGGATWVSPTGTSSSGLNLDDGLVMNHECRLPQYEHLAVIPWDPRTTYVTICAARADGRNYRAYKTTDGGATWQHVLNVDNSVPNSMPAMPNVEGGWQDFSPFSWTNSGRGRGLAVGRSIEDPAPTRHAVLFTNLACLYKSEDQAASWRQAYTRQQPPQGSPGPNQRWRSIGLEVTTTWNFYVSEDDPDLQFICYTDICFARSLDRGRTWFPIRPQNFNTIYELAFSPVGLASGQPRPMWAAASNLHDLPSWEFILDTPYVNTNRWSGAVLTTPATTPGGSAWVSFGAGLPAAPVVSVVADRSNPPNLWAAVWGSGVYRYNAQMQMWEPRNGSGTSQLGNGANRHVYRLHWQPDAANPAGRLYCVISGRRSPRQGQDPTMYSAYNNLLDDKGGVWLSTDGGASWACLTLTLGEAARYPRDFAVDPNDNSRIYLCTGSWPRVTDGPMGPQLQAAGRGGLWRTTNANDPPNAIAWSEVTSFRTTLDARNYHQNWLHPFAPFVDPHKPTKLWVTTQDWGTWVTEDITAAPPRWVEYRNLPFMRTHRLRFAGGDSPGIHVTTFGGGVLELQRQVFFIADRSAFSQFEVTAAQVVNNERPFRAALYVVFDGFLPGELDIPAGPVSQVPPTAAPTLQVTRRSDGMPPTNFTIRPSASPLLTEINPIPEDVAQRFTFVYDVVFTGQAGTADFPTSGAALIDVRATKGWLSAAAEVTLFQQANPFMLEGSIPWFSPDLRVFRVTQGGPPPFTGAPQLTGTTKADALNYLRQEVLPRLNNATLNFDAIPDTTLALLPRDASGAIFNFAVARVRYVPPSVATQDQLRVFFRTFRTQSASMDYQPAATYRSGLNTAQDLIPLLGIGQGPGTSREVVSIPYFDEDRPASGAALTQQLEPTSFQLPTGGTTQQWRFFGVLLDFNQTDLRFPELVDTAALNGPWPPPTLKSIQQLVRGYHQCLIAEVSYPPDPIATGATPASSENLAQRNLAISESANPGTPESRTVHHTFEIHQARPGWPPEQPNEDGEEPAGEPPEDLWGAPDELMIRWSGLPAGTRATLFLNTDDVDEITALSTGRLEGARLEREGPNLIGWSPGEITYVPLPRTTRTIPALLTVHLPSRIRHGQRFSIVVRHISGTTRAVLGTFELSIPVRRAEELLWDEEDNLAVFRWIQRSIDPSDQWAPVLGQYVEQIASRVRGFGGHPDAIPPSPDGAGDHHQPPKGRLEKS